MEVDALIRALLIHKIVTRISCAKLGDSDEYIFEARIPWATCGNRSVRSKLIIPAGLGLVTDAQIELVLRQLLQGHIEVSELRRLAEQVV